MKKWREKINKQNIIGVIIMASKQESVLIYVPLGIMQFENRSHESKTDSSRKYKLIKKLFGTHFFNVFIPDSALSLRTNLLKSVALKS